MKKRGKRREGGSKAVWSVQGSCRQLAVIETSGLQGEVSGGVAGGAFGHVPN